MNTKLILIIALLTAFLAGCTQSCPTITKVCPDGSYPAQDSTTCDFDACPETKTPQGVEFIPCNPDIIGVKGACTLEYFPVCGDDGNEYGNDCAACRGGATEYYVGTCVDDNSLN